MYILFVVAGLIFFEKGRINLLWFVSYLPFLLVVIVLTTTYFSWTAAFELPAAWETIVDVAAVLVCCLAISLYCLAISAHSTPVHMWHQDGLPREVTTKGPYHYIRHPIYSAYILYFFGALLIAFNWYMLVVVVFGITTLNYTARQEEKQLLGSTLSSGYEAYMKTTGRFFPRLLG
jgi:protein-S-isoprenylcysteine O-methyltransferase Ste14